MTATLNPIKRHRAHCRDTRAQMSEYLEGGLDEESAAKLERHLRWCPNCGRMLSNLSRTITGLRGLREMPPPADEPKPQA